ncbi:outer membrane autotransporter protein [Plasticicumulans lactativorans]|uniref:Outer membrane autotransporter protein n=1 Tax=Plasticicumulans lactativorans TaxID=1133106 RepID=A0A4R2L5F2_9GAMM|nr:autotransporter outer membrane beta-barrel domain-containing protein [Plasticicumulans lactativorans]TCO80497.1 outer membrane autotransporter protein [Plasticicumulans lactativorans]
MAGHLQSAWDHGGAVELGALFGLLGNDADASPAAYAADLRQLSPQATFAPGAQGLASAQGFATRALSCPKFEGTTAMLVEGECTWLRVTALSGEQSNDNGVADFDIDSTVYQIGGQVEFRPGWFLGGSAAYADDRLKSTDRRSRADGSSGYGALTLKHQTGPWLFAGSVFGGGGSFDTTRNISLPGYAAQASGDPNTSSVGLLLRSAHTIGHEAFYVRPSLDLGTIHVRSGGYQERGAGALALDVDAASQTTWIATPMVEIGGRVALDEHLVLRPYVSVGVSFLSNDAWTQRARLTAAPPGAGSLTTTIPHDRTVGRVSAGMQLYTRDAFDLRLQYDGEFSDSRTTHGGSLVASYRF